MVQVTAELREQLQSKEKEHEMAVHTLKDQVKHTDTIRKQEEEESVRNDLTERMIV